MSSLFFQVVMQVAPEALLDQLHSRFLRGSLAALAMHPSSNFGVQAFLSALQTPQQVPSRHPHAAKRVLLTPYLC